MYRELSYLAETEPNTRAGRLARQSLERGRRAMARTAPPAPAPPEGVNHR